MVRILKGVGWSILKGVGWSSWVAAIEADSPRSAGRGSPPGQYLRRAFGKQRERERERETERGRHV